MNRKVTTTHLIATAMLALCASGASADDNSMSVLTGESYAYFNGLDYSAGKFNVARASLPDDGATAMKAPQARPHESAMKMPQAPSGAADELRERIPADPSVANAAGARSRARAE